MTVRTLARPLTTRLVAADNLHMRVRPSLRISTTQRSADGLEITIPARRNFVLVAFLGAWLVGWSVGEFFAFRELIAGKTDAPAIFLAGWLVMWTIGGATAAYVWLWMLTGKEVVRLRYPALVIKRDLLGFGPAKEFDLSHTRNLRVATAFRN